MNNHNRKRSNVTGTLWLGMAVFFVVFCSCPVKRYIRLHLYQDKPLVERTDGAHYSSYDMKDCTVAERHQQSDITLLTVLHRPADELPDYYSCVFVPAFPVRDIFYSMEQGDSHLCVSLSVGEPMPIPVFLWVRHLQV